MMTSVEWEKALDILRQQAIAPSSETLPLGQALGRVLAADMPARISVPPFDKSPFDGYAFRAEDTPGDLRIVAEIAAGCGSLPSLEKGQAVRIFTGAPIPPGADAVAKQEDVRSEGKTLILTERAAPGANVIRAGEDLQAGAPLLQAGEVLSPGHLGLLASQGYGRISVYRRPKAVLIPTGTELSQPGEERRPYGIYNSSTAALSAVLERIGFVTTSLDIVPDEPDMILAASRKALENDADAVFTTGGASVGDYDFAVSTAEKLGLEQLFRKVKVKPGGTLLVSRMGKKLLINLSGNPAAAMMSVLAVLRPWLEEMCGIRREAEELFLPISAPMPKTCTVTRLLRGHLGFTDGRACFVEHQGRGNGNLSSFLGCDLIGVVPGGSGPLSPGTLIRVLRLPPWLV